MRRRTLAVGAALVAAGVAAVPMWMTTTAGNRPADAGWADVGSPSEASIRGLPECAAPGIAKDVARLLALHTESSENSLLLQPDQLRSAGADPTAVAAQQNAWKQLTDHQ